MERWAGALVGFVVTLAAAGRVWTAAAPTVVQAAPSFWLSFTSPVSVKA